MKKLSVFTLLAICILFGTSMAFSAPPPNMQPPPMKKDTLPDDMGSPCSPEYAKVTNDAQICEALDLMKDTVGNFSRTAILGENLTERPMKITFRELSSIKPEYANYDALGMKKGKQLFIYINAKHYNAPTEALAALLSHEALHQDEFNSIQEETYAWTMEATVWADLCKKNPSLRNNKMSSLAARENILLKMLENANYSNVLIKNTVVNHPGYQTLPLKSPGFE